MFTALVIHQTVNRSSAFLSHNYYYSGCKRNGLVVQMEKIAQVLYPPTTHKVDNRMNMLSLSSEHLPPFQTFMYGCLMNHFYHAWFPIYTALLTVLEVNMYTPVSIHKVEFLVPMLLKRGDILYTFKHCFMFLLLPLLISTGSRPPYSLHVSYFLPINALNSEDFLSQIMDLTRWFVQLWHQIN